MLNAIFYVWSIYWLNWWLHILPGNVQNSRLFCSTVVGAKVLMLELEREKSCKILLWSFMVIHDKYLYIEQCISYNFKLHPSIRSVVILEKCRTPSLKVVGLIFPFHFVTFAYFTSLGDRLTGSLYTNEINHDIKLIQYPYFDWARYKYCYAC